MTQVINQGQTIFALDDNKAWEVEDKFGFNFDNAPDLYAVFTIEKIEDDNLYVSLPILWEKPDEPNSETKQEELNKPTELVA